MADPRVSVTFLPIDVNIASPRTLTLTPQTKTIPIGRSSKRGPEPRTPAKDNGWFDLRVMSRDHAELIFLPEKKIVSIRDCGSTHGTYLHNCRLIAHEPMDLFDGDILQFGVDVERDEEDHPALTVSCKVDWIDKYEAQFQRSLAQADLWSSAAGGPREVPQGIITLERQLTPESKSEPEARPTSTNTFSTPGYGDSDIMDGIGPFMQVPAYDGPEVTITNIDNPGSSMEPIDLVSPVPRYVELPANDGLEQPLPEVSVEHALGYPHDHPVGTEALMLEDDGEDESDIDYADEDEDECVQDEDEEDESDSESESSESSDIESSDPSSISYTIDGVHFKFGTDSDVEKSSSDSESDSDPISDSEASSDVDSDDEVSNNEDYDFINPMLLTQKGVTGITTVGHTDHATDSGDQANQQGYIPGVVDALPDLPDQTPLGPHQQSLFTNSESDVSPYTDGPFACNKATYKESGLDGTSLQQAEDEEICKKEIAEERSTLVTEVPSLKRKFELEPSSVPVPEPAHNISQTAGDDVKSESQVIEAISSALAETEPPRKRVKSNNSPTLNLASYTATAVISALLGGIGTIALLASLPPEYFQ